MDRLRRRYADAWMKAETVREKRKQTKNNKNRGGGGGEANFGMNYIMPNSQLRRKTLIKIELKVMRRGHKSWVSFPQTNALLLYSSQFFVLESSVRLNQAIIVIVFNG